MRSLFTAVPFLLQIALFGGIYTQRNSIAPRPAGHVDVCDLHRQRDRIAAQLAILEHRPRQFLPRGVAPTPSGCTPLTPRNN